MEPTLIYKAKAAKTASYFLANTTLQQRNDAIKAIAKAIKEQSATILAANASDLATAPQNSLTDRLLLTQDRLDEMVVALEELVLLPEILNETIEQWQHQNGMTLLKKRVPLGLVAIIYEARPNVTVDAAALCIKSGNAIILKGGKEALNSNKCLVAIMQEALKSQGFPESTVELVTDTSRQTTMELMKLNKYIDVLIPRGGASLINTVIENATVPTLQTGAGICHTYVDEDADLTMALQILINAKCSRPSVCNACETLLVHKAVAEEFLALAIPELEKNHVEVRCEDYDVEFNDLIISIKIVESLQEAIDHINNFGTQHSDCIVSENLENVKSFMDNVDSATLYHNASTRFTDGFEFGFGAEIGISNQKLHARGPLGLKELTTTKYLIYGKGQIR